jgi:hypothetical protein
MQQTITVNIEPVTIPVRVQYGVPLIPSEPIILTGAPGANTAGELGQTGLLNGSPRPSLWQCVDATVGAYVWIPISSGWVFNTDLAVWQQLTAVMEDGAPVLMIS